MLGKKQASEAPPRVGFSFLYACKYWAKIEGTSKRLEKLEWLAKLYLRISIEYEDDLPNLLMLL